MFYKTIPTYNEIDLGDPEFVSEEIATWDMIFHVPVVSNTFVTKYTGLVLTKDFNQAGTLGKAYYRRVYYAMLLGSIIDNKIPNEHDKMMNLYLLSHDTEKQLGFAYITALIADADDMTGYADIALESGLTLGITQDEIKKALQIPMIEMLIKKYKLTILNIHNTISIDNHQRGY